MENKKNTKKKLKLKLISNINKKRGEKKKTASNKLNNPTEKNKSISVGFEIFLSLLFIFIIIISYKTFGLLITALIGFVYLFVVFCTQILDLCNKKSKLRKLIKGLFIFCVTMGIIGIIGFIGFFLYIKISAPEFDVDKLHRSEMTEIYDNENNLITTLGNQNRDIISYSDLPEVFVNALVATEDSRYFQHNGFDAPRFFKAALQQVIGIDAGGASTLTMQVSKNNLTSTNISITRKFTDIYLSIFKLERALTKQQIIEYYVNEPFMGNGTYGVQQACQLYFGKDVSQINLSEAALLAGLFQAPSAYDPFNNTEMAEERRAIVLSLMVKHGYISEKEKEIAESIKINDLLVNANTYKESEFQGYVDEVIKEIVNTYEIDPYLVPLQIYTNMDRQKQLALNDVFNGNTYKWPNDTIQAGAVAIESTSGKIIAIGAGRNRTGARVYSYATDINRQIGSTAKPLFDYGPGIEYNNWSTGKLFSDSATYYSGSSVRIGNVDGYTNKDQPLAWCLAQSKNTCAVRAFQQIENEKIKQFVTTLGINPEIDSEGFLHEAHALGGFNGASPLQMAAAYSAFSNGGYYYKPYTINQIVFKEQGETETFSSTKVKAMSDSTAYMITSILKTIAQSTGVAYAVDSDVALKTGTTNYDEKTIKEYGYTDSGAPDGWIAGYTSNISMAMWTGYIENQKGIYMKQNEMATHRNKLYKALAIAVFDDKGKSFKKPSSVVSVEVEIGTDPIMLPSETTPAENRATYLFKRGTEPTEISGNYISLNSPLNLNVSYDNQTASITWSSVAKASNIKEKDFGEFGYVVTLNDGTEIFTQDTSYSFVTTSPYGTYEVRAAYKLIRSNMSLAASYTLADPNAIIEDKIEIIVPSAEEIKLSLGYTVTEDMINSTNEKVKVNDIETNEYTKTIAIKDKNNNTVENIDTSVSNEYIVTYKISYNGEEKTFTRKYIIG